MGSGTILSPKANVDALYRQAANVSYSHDFSGIDTALILVVFHASGGSEFSFKLYAFSKSGGATVVKELSSYTPSGGLGMTVTWNGAVCTATSNGYGGKISFVYIGS